MQTFSMTIKRGTHVLAEVRGSTDASMEPLSTVNKILETERFLERILGVRVHINMVEEVSDE